MTIHLTNVRGEKYQMSRLQVQETVEIAGYAAELASSLVKESIEESGREEGQWSIPCSKDCHSDRHETGGQCAGSGQLCWTPESTLSLDTMDTAQSREDLRSSRQDLGVLDDIQETVRSLVRERYGFRDARDRKMTM